LQNQLGNVNLSDYRNSAHASPVSQPELRAPSRISVFLPVMGAHGWANNDLYTLELHSTKFGRTKPNIVMISNPANSMAVHLIRRPSRYRSRCLEHLASGDEGVHSPSARNQNEPNFWRLQMRREGKPIRQRTKRSTCHPFVKGAVQRPSQIASSRLSDFIESSPGCFVDRTWCLVLFINRCKRRAS